MATKSLPSTMRVWKYASADEGIDKNLKLHTSEPLPKPKANQHLIQTLTVGLNPVDYKPAEAPVIGRFAVKKPATPGFDFSGRIVTAADGSNLEPGQLVYGTASTNPMGGGALAEYIAAPDSTVVAFQSSTRLSAQDMGGAAVAGITAYTSLKSHIHPGSRVFMNGGSGGVGTYAIQIAKALGAHVTVSCSARNAELCRSLGADKVLDYGARPVLDQLREAARSGPFDHVVDNVFSDPALFFQAHDYTTPSAVFAEVASAPSLAFLRFALSGFLLPSFLGGARRKLSIVAADIKRENLEKIRDWIADGTISPVTDEVFPFEKAAEAFRKLKSSRAVGKIIVRVAE